MLILIVSMLVSYSPLFQAACRGYLDTVRVLLEANANPNLRINSGATPLFAAASDGHSDVVDYSSQSKCQSKP